MTRYLVVLVMWWVQGATPGASPPPLLPLDLGKGPTALLYSTDGPIYVPAMQVPLHPTCPRTRRPSSPCAWRPAVPHARQGRGSARAPGGFNLIGGKGGGKGH